VQRAGLVGVDTDGDGLEGRRAHRPGVGDRPHRRLVDLRHEDDDVGPRGQHHVLVLVDDELAGHRVVVPPDPLHQHEEDRHRGDRDPRTEQELGDEDHDEDQPGDRQPDAVDDPAADHPRPRGRIGLAAQQPRPVPDHAGLAQGERHEDTYDVELDQPRHLGVEGDDQQDGEG
jgi:hypothetical protein